MRIGVTFPQTEIGNDPAAIRDYAQAVEDLGFSHVLAYDHVLGARPEQPEAWRGPYTYEHPFHEPFVLFGFLAGVTRTLELATGVIVLPQRETALVAKQAAAVDVLSGGRLRLGVGVGWNEVEYVALDQDFHTRGRRIEEQVELMRRLWTEEVVAFTGRWHTVPDAGLNPLPVQRPIPIWFGGHADVVLRRLARMGDGWLPNYRTAEDARPHLERLAGFLAERGRAGDAIGIEPVVRYGDGDPEAWRRLVEEWAAAGATHLRLDTMRCGFGTPDAHVAAAGAFAEAVLGD